MNAKGLGYGAASVVLVSAAQLAMRWSVTQLPRLETLPVAGLEAHPLAAAMLVLGICAYAASLLCWLAALARMPLGRAYSLLSLSYPIVYVAAALLPGLGGSLSIGKTTGVVLVVMGVVLINARGRGFTRPTEWK